MNRDGNCESLWQASTDEKSFSNQSIPDTDFDVLIAGAGITGLTTALQLQLAGKKCIIAEAHNIGFGTSGGTTAHLNTMLDTPYYTIRKNFSEGAAKLVAEGAKTAIAHIKKNNNNFKIDCDFEEKTAYLFSLNEKQNEELENIASSSWDVGVPVTFVNSSPFPLPYSKIAEIRNQAQFHPGKYLSGLATAFINAGGIIVEDCRVESVEENTIVETVTSRGKIRASFFIYATHIPPGVNILHFRCAPYRSYALAVTLKDDKYPDALGYDMHDPYHYYRTHVIDGQKYLVAGGEDHKTGHEENTQACFRRLESHVRSHYNVDKIVHRWSSQYFEPVDGLPYIGNLPGSGENIFVATGFGGNGMIYGTLSGIILADIIVTGDSKYRNVFDPNRLKPIAGFSNFVKEAADVVGHLIGDKFSVDKIEALVDIAPGEAKVVKYEGHSIAIYKSTEGQVYALNSSCTHIKCNVAWNSAEKTWDCPCHGSRFAIDGTMLTAPARKDLERINIMQLADSHH